MKLGGEEDTIMGEVWLHFNTMLETGMSLLKAQ